MHFDLVIVGGGLAGLSLACALRETPLKIALIEQRPPRRADGWDARVYAISPVNAVFLERIGAWKHLDPARIARIAAMEESPDVQAETARAFREALVKTARAELTRAFSAIACARIHAPHARTRAERKLESTLRKAGLVETTHV